MNEWGNEWMKDNESVERHVVGSQETFIEWVSEWMREWVNEWITQSQSLSTSSWPKMLLLSLFLGKLCSCVNPTEAAAFFSHNCFSANGSHFLRVYYLQGGLYFIIPSVILHNSLHPKGTKQARWAFHVPLAGKELKRVKLSCFDSKSHALTKDLNFHLVASMLAGLHRIMLLEFVNIIQSFKRGNQSYRNILTEYLKVICDIIHGLLHDHITVIISDSPWA